MNFRFSGKAVLIVLGALFILVSLFMKKGERIKGVAFFLAWLVPGAGHVLLGKWKKGLFFFLILGATYAFGMWIAGFRPVSFDDNPFYFVGQFGSGATLLIAKLRGAEKAIIRDGLNPSWFDPGLLYVCVVGLLNLVVMMSILDVKPAEVAVTEADVLRPAAAASAPPMAPAVPAAPVPVPEKPA
ncbi:MAG: hypothetical protein JO332_17250 [Planctomycetaceae bacterium]|nr:hypothetical protein [Planctomycetaceae bacterium]